MNIQAAIDKISQINQEQPSEVKSTVLKEAVSAAVHQLRKSRTKLSDMKRKGIKIIP